VEGFHFQSINASKNSNNLFVKNHRQIPVSWRSAGWVEFFDFEGVFQPSYRTLVAKRTA